MTCNKIYIVGSGVSKSFCLLVNLASTIGHVPVERPPTMRRVADRGASSLLPRALLRLGQLCHYPAWEFYFIQPSAFRSFLNFWGWLLHHHSFSSHHVTQKSASVSLSILSCAWILICGQILSFFLAPSLVPWITHKSLFGAAAPSMHPVMWTWVAFRPCAIWTLYLQQQTVQGKPCISQKLQPSTARLDDRVL